MANTPIPNSVAIAMPTPIYTKPDLSVVASSSTANVEYVRPELSIHLNKYELIEDCIAGSEAVKAKGTKYLPHPDEREIRPGGPDIRYHNYLLRAHFYNATGRTLEGLVGQVFLRDPVVELPTACKILEKDADGSGQSLEQIAKRAEEHVLSLGRCGVFADFPAMEGRSVSRADLLNGTIRPTLSVYHPRDIRNWRVITVNGRVLLSLVVLAESYNASDDGFETIQLGQFRVLRLEAISRFVYKYTVEIYKQKAENGPYESAEKFEPRDGKGNLLQEIPFTFIGAKTNNSTVDKPPLYDLADLNMCHYRNSADNEDSCFLVGQPTPVVSGITQQWNDEVLKGELRLGSRAVIPLPEGGSAELLQAAENTLVGGEMEKKERRMVALGAKLVEQKQVQRTATEVSSDDLADTSVLASTAKNVEAAIKWCLEWCAIFTGEVTQDRDARSKAVKFELNTEFDLTKLDATQLAAVVKLWQAEGITDEEFRDVMRRAGYATMADDEWKQQREDNMQSAVNKLAAETAAVTENSVPPNA